LADSGRFRIAKRERADLCARAGAGGFGRRVRARVWRRIVEDPVLQGVVVVVFGVRVRIIHPGDGDETLGDGAQVGQDRVEPGDAAQIIAHRLAADFLQHPHQVEDEQDELRSQGHDRR
jgi:hypothetical protein